MLTTEWRKSSHSGVNGNCVQARIDRTGAGVEVGDTKEPGRSMVFDQPEWQAFVAGVRDGEFDLPAQ